MRRVMVALLAALAAPALAADEPPDDCARFVNQVLGQKLRRKVRGNAWDVQLLPSNRHALTLVWRIPDESFVRDERLLLRRSGDRVEHFRQLYAALEREKPPRGVIGFVFRHSPWRAVVARQRTVLPQTHIAFVGGRRPFSVHNDTSGPRSVEQLLGQSWGPISLAERPLAERILRTQLSVVLSPGARIGYTDFVLQQRFVRDRECSLLEMLLRKLPPPDRQIASFRPVSFSRLNLGRRPRVQSGEAH
jgi:hypothetical protein